MQKIKRCLAVAVLATVLCADAAFAAGSRQGFNDEYVYATTRSLNDDVDMNPALKVTLLPLTVVLDTAFLPFAVVAGFVT